MRNATNSFKLDLVHGANDGHLLLLIIEGVEALGVRGHQDGIDAETEGSAGRGASVREEDHLVGGLVDLLEHMLERGGLLQIAKLGVEVAIDEQGHVALVGARQEHLIL